jgi:heme/copper-type cytochrome/quinol oxidase subunit 3
MAEADMSAFTPAETEAARAAEEEGFYHEAGINGAWTGSRLAIGGLVFLYACFAFAYFYLRSLNSAGRWANTDFRGPSTLLGTIIMLAMLTSAFVNYYGLQRIKSGHKIDWQACGVAAMILGLGAVVLQLIELINLPFPPGSSGYASVFTGFYPVFVVTLVGGLIWLEILLVGSHSIPAISFVEQPPTFAEVRKVQRFQASLSSFSTVWTFMALVALLFWFLFYAL